MYSRHLCGIAEVARFSQTPHTGGKDLSGCLCRRFP